MIHFISLIDSAKLLRKHARQVASNPYITFQRTGSFCRQSLHAAHLCVWLNNFFKRSFYFSGSDPFVGYLCITFHRTGSFCRQSLRAARSEDHLPVAESPHVLSPTPFVVHMLLSGIFVWLLPYPFPEEQLCSCVCTVRHPQALGNLKDLTMVIFFLNSMPHLWIICQDIFIQNLFILQCWFSRGCKGMQELKKVLAGLQLCRSHHRFWQPKLGHGKDISKVISMSHA